MKRNVRLMILTILLLFIMPLVFIQGVNAEPLESFAENPIPYWEDGSIGVKPTWHSDEQIVTFGWDNDSSASGYLHSMSDVSDWNALNNPITTDGDIASITTENDDSYERYDCNVPDGSIDWSNGYTFKVRWRANVSNGAGDLKLMFISMSDNDYSGDILYQSGDIASVFSANVWYIYIATIYHTNAGNEECLSILVKNTAHTRVDIDLIRVWDEIGNLDVKVPLSQQPIQNIETMGNFSALNSTVRFQMYDTNTGSGLWCDVNSTQVTFPDDTYAIFNNFARINFSLNEEISIFKIYVYAQNMTLINYYSDYAGLANKDYLRMIDSIFNGTYQLWYLQGDVGYLEGSEEMNIFQELFLSTELWGYFGPLGLVIASILLMKKEKALWIFFIIVDSLVIAQYLFLVEATPDYWWQIVIMILGVITCAIKPVTNR